MNSNYDEANTGNENSEEFSNAAEEAAFELFLEAVRTESNRSKTLILLPDSARRLTHVLSAIKELLTINDEEYTMKIQRNRVWFRSLTIIVECEGIGVAAKDYHIFKDIINSIDSFTSSSMIGERMRYYFGLHNVFTEIKQAGGE